MITAISLFFVFGTLMSFLAALMLLFPGSVLDSLWSINHGAREGLARFGIYAVVLMATVSAGCGLAAWGLWHCQSFGYHAAIIILSINLTADCANAVLMHDWRTLIGLPIGSTMLWCLYKHRKIFV